MRLRCSSHSARASGSVASILSSWVAIAWLAIWFSASSLASTSARPGERNRANGHSDASNPRQNRPSSVSRSQSGTILKMPSQEKDRNRAASPSKGAERVMMRPSDRLNRIRMRPRATARRASPPWSIGGFSLLPGRSAISCSFSVGNEDNSLCGQGEACDRNVMPETRRQGNLSAHGLPGDRIDGFNRAMRAANPARSDLHRMGARARCGSGRREPEPQE